MVETRALLRVGCTRLLFEMGETRASAARVWRFLASDTCTPCQIGHVFGGFPVPNTCTPCQMGHAFGGFPVPNTCTPNWQCLGMHYESKKSSHIVQDFRADALQKPQKILYRASSRKRRTISDKNLIHRALAYGCLLLPMEISTMHYF